MKKIEIAFTDKESTPWGELSLLHRMLERMQIEEVLEKIPLPQQGSNRGYSPKQIIQNFWVGVWSGANCLEHLEVTRHDALIREIFDCKQMAESRAFQRYSNKFTQSINQEVFTGLYKWFLKNLHFDNYKMDFGSTILTRYGDQEGSKKGYNTKKPRRKSHHPIIAFLSDCRMIMGRQGINKRPKAVGKQLRLFEESEIYKNYRYSCFITNLNQSAKMVYDFYRNRAEAENRIKEIKHDFGAESFNMKSFWAKEATLNFVMLAYNLMNLGKQY